MLEVRRPEAVDVRTDLKLFSVLFV